MADKNSADIGFEKKIWDAACVLRGNIDASEYKSVVLGLIFLKYISDRFEEKYNQLKEEGDGFEEDIDEYTSEGIFFVPQGARWSDVAAKAHTPEIGVAIDNAMRSIERENKRLKDILPKNFARPELDKRRLGDVVDLFTNIKMIDQGNEKVCDKESHQHNEWCLVVQFSLFLYFWLIMPGTHDQTNHHRAFGAFCHDNQ